MSSRFRLAAGLFIELLALVCIIALGDPRAHLLVFLCLFALACAGFFIGWRAARVRSFSLSSIILIAIFLRAPFFFTTPRLSDDVWRYLHDGRAQAAGVSPYAYAPADSLTIPFRGAEHARINHPDLVTIYPPVAQAFFALNARLGSTLIGWRLLLLLSELAIMLVLARVLQQRGSSLANLALYAWHPLAVIEVAGSAHLEPIGIALMLAALFAAGRATSGIAGGALFGVAAAFKFIAAPVLLVTDYTRKPKLLAAAAVVAIGLYAFYWSEGSVFGSLGTFAVQWEGNASMYALLAAFTDGHRARILVATLLVCALLAIRGVAASNYERAALAVLALLLLSPVGHPWYLLWLVCFAPVIERHWLRDVTLAWSVLVVAAYAAPELAWLEYAVVYGMLAVTACAPALRHFQSRVSDPSRRRIPRTPI